MDVDGNNDMLAKVAAGEMLELYALVPSNLLPRAAVLLTEAGTLGLRCRLISSRA